MKGLSKKEQESALNEVRILASLDHPNIIQYKEAFIEKSTKSLCIVMEFADSGDLHQVLNDAKKSKTTIPEMDVWKYTIQILAGLKYLHEMKICHRDLNVNTSLTFNN
jgi:NIMA (never in mitosis gene a)-related kinase